MQLTAADRHRRALLAISRALRFDNPSRALAVSSIKAAADDRGRCQPINLRLSTF
jgi:hypothetical protein